MNSQQTKEIVQILTQKGILFEEGLTDEEILAIETKFDIKFPADYKLFLQEALPTSDGFVNWREGLHSSDTASKINLQLNQPLEGLLVDVQSNNFWFDKWGDKPDNDDDKALIATRHYANYPKLIPIYSNRYIPSHPGEDGNPVFSVHQTDIVYYGFDLATYFANEFDFTLSDSFDVADQMIRDIEFWGFMADNN